MLLSPEKDTLKIEQMRFLKEAAYLKPMIGKKRVFIILDAEKMNEQAGNSLLKILEEPPFFSHIILVTRNPFIILSTVKSRCQELKFLPIPREEIENQLKEANMDSEKAQLLSFLVCGNLKRAMNIDWEDNQEQRKRSWRIFRIFVNGEDAAAFLKAYAFRSRGQVEEELKNILEMLSSFCRDLILIKENGDAGLLINPDYEDKMRSLIGSLELEQFLNLFIKIEDSLSALKRNVNIKLYISSMLLKIMGRDYV
jgi:DNA polymerase-3 subunit delta'